MKYHNEQCQAWCAIDDEATKDAIKASEHPEYMGAYGEWIKCTMKLFCKGGIYRAPIVERTPLELEDIKQGDAVRKKGDIAWSMICPSSLSVMLLFNHTLVSYDTLMEEYEIRSIGGEWRGCFK